MPALTHVHLGGRCDLRCTVCDCHEAPSPCDAQGVPHAVRQGGDRLVFRGEAAASPAFHRTLERAMEAAWGEVWVRTSGQRFAEPDEALKLYDRGVRGVIVPLFSQSPTVHDRVAGREGAMVTALRAMRSLATAGMSVAVETPILPARLQDPEAVVRLAARAVPRVASARFYLPMAPQPAVLAPPTWDSVRDGLSRALTACDALGVATAFHEFDAVPLCALGHDEAHQRRYRFDPRRPARARDGFAHAAPCEGCAVKAHCLGPNTAYTAAHPKGEGLAPFTSKPRALFEQRTTPRREWNDGHREAASKAINRVLRPTVHCNQDCPFCSANETTENVYRRPDEMFRQISRMARAGVQYISFSGGEPTLSKDLVHYIRVAARLGIKDIELVTNGALIDGAAKVKPLAEAGLNKAFVSLHAHDEVLSRRATSKVGDWERSVRAIHCLLDAGVGVDVNHVITSVNYPYLPRFADFVSGTWGGRVGISFAFVTPQFKALENAALVPRISEVMPYLHKAMTLLESRGSPFVVGSRQGIPPCFLGEFTAWSDFVKMSPQALADDEPQKTRGPACAACRFNTLCVGLWKPYAARYGFDELRAVPGPPLTPEEVSLIAGNMTPRRFSEVSPSLDTPPRPDLNAPPPEPEPPRTPRRLAVLRAAPERTVRLALLGSGPHAQRLARALRQTPGLALAGVASPHLLDRDPGPFANVPLDRDAAALLDRVSPDGVVVASATVAHHALAELALARGLATLIEKPLARTLDEARALVALAERAPVMVAHSMVFSPGMRALRSRLADGSFGRVLRASLTRRMVPGSGDAPMAWGRDGVYQTLYHAAYLLLSAAPRGEASVKRVEARGASRPELIRVEVALPSGVAGEIVLDGAATTAVDELAVSGEHGRRLAWVREGADETLVHDTPQGERATSIERGSDAEGMFAAFRELTVTRGESPTPARDGLAAMQLATAVVDALAEHIQRPNAPRHVASPALRG